VWNRHETTVQVFWVYDLFMRVLITEDDTTIRSSLGQSLREQNYAVDEACSATEARGLLENYEFDALIMDVRLPEGGNAGFELIASLRETGLASPVLFLTARDSLADRVAGLDAGGDDYLVKPFELEEVHARLRALLRRARPSVSKVFEYNDFKLDWQAHLVTKAEQPVHLTAKEFGILEVLVSNPGRVFSREEITDRVWGSDFEAETNVVDVYVKNLRRKLGAWVVETVVSMGYRFPRV
jgi:DNA-binding response OmpR family regulator